MRRNDWFYNTFIPYLFQRAGTGNGIWLSRKQTAICVENMEKHTARFQTLESYGDFWSHNYYTATWNGRAVTLDYSKKNGCGIISFGASKEEQEAMRKENEERELEHERRIAAIWYRKRRERYNQTVADLRNSIEASKEDYHDDLEDYGKPLFDLAAVLAPLERKLAIWLSVAE